MTQIALRTEIASSSIHDSGQPPIAKDDNVNRTVNVSPVKTIVHEVVVQTDMSVEGITLEDVVESEKDRENGSPPPPPPTEKIFGEVEDDPPEEN